MLKILRGTFPLHVSVNFYILLGMHLMGELRKLKVQILLRSPYNWQSVYKTGFG